MNLALSYSKFNCFRVNVFRQRGSVGIAVRKINFDIATLDDLGLSPILTNVMMTKRGLILVVGATGSGKSTSLAAMIDHRNSNTFGHIITVEDPVEFVHRHRKSIVNQREVGADTHSFQAALKSAMRQAPDVILIGEIRDRETMEPSPLLTPVTCALQRSTRQTRTKPLSALSISFRNPNMRRPFSNCPSTFGPSSHGA